MDENNKKEQDSPTCYMCSNPKTSREHAPPNSLFPEMATFGRDLRKNLVTVPSCDAHNSAKSKDDEFFRATILLATVHQSAAGEHQFFQKLLKAAARSGKLYESFFNEQGVLPNRAGVVIQIDRDRFDICIEHMVRALFFDTFNEKWLAPMRIVSPNFFSGIQGRAAIPHELSAEESRAMMQALSGQPTLGHNPEVFRYWFKYERENQAFVFRGEFFDLFNIIAYWFPQMAEHPEYTSARNAE